MSERLDNLPALEGWVNLAEASEILGISRQHAWRRARLTNDGLPGGWKTVHRVGDKPFYVVSVSEVVSELGNHGLHSSPGGTMVAPSPPVAREKSTG